MSARGLKLYDETIAALGESEHDPEWTTVGRLFDCYLIGFLSNRVDAETWADGLAHASRFAEAARERRKAATS